MSDEHDVLPQLVAREPIFHRQEFGTTRSDFEAMTTEDYWEVGASGTVYDRSFVLDVLEERFEAQRDDPWSAEGFRCRFLGGTSYLLTYTLSQGERVSRRVTIWENRHGRWLASFHQGTPVRSRVASSPVQRVMMKP